MLQESQQMEIPSTSPEAMTDHQSILSSYILKAQQMNVEEDLIADYNDFRQKQVRISFSTQLKNSISSGCAYSLAILKEFWRQIIPSAVRGSLGNTIMPESRVTYDKDAILFDQYKKKKTRFFLIVFDHRSSEEQMQEAYEKSTYIVTEGLGIRLSELDRQTNCKKWKIQGWTKIKYYSILFFRFDLFGNLRNFGHLSKQLIDAYADDQKFLEGYKKQLTQTYERFEDMEKEFANSYLEKQDRMHFQ